MCGFVGYVGIDPRDLDIDAMLASMAHRGPDGHAVHRGEGFAVGHHRLAVIDLDGGAQPITSEDGRWVLVGNHEIYNYRALRSELEGLGHRFRTESGARLQVQRGAVGRSTRSTSRQC